MKIYWNNRNRRAEIFDDFESDGAQSWEGTEPKSHILIGNKRIFVYSPTYHVDGYSLTAEDLEALLKKLRAKDSA